MKDTELEKLAPFHHRSSADQRRTLAHARALAMAIFIPPTTATVACAHTRPSRRPWRFVGGQRGVSASGDAHLAAVSLYACRG